MTQVHSKLIVITRRDLTPGAQAVQSAHAAIDFQHQFPQISQNWNKLSNYLILLSVDNEDSLKHQIQKIIKFNLSHVVFKEPDMDNQITAVCIEPSEKSRKLFSHLPLTLKEYQ